MKFENASSSVEALDSRWYRRFEETAFDDYESLAGSRDARAGERARFLSGEVENPTLDYPFLEEFDDQGKEAALLALKEDVLDLETNEVVKKVYRTKINESIATVRMLSAAKSGDDRRFARYSAFIYGLPQPDQMNYIASTVYEQAKQLLDDPDTERRQAAERIVALLEKVDIPAVDGVSREVLPEGQRIEGEITGVDEVVGMFTQALEELGLDDWEVLVDTDRGLTAFSVSQETKTVKIPSEEALAERGLSKRNLKGLIAHEVETHALRRHNGERSKLQLLGLGLDRYLKGEEGVATYNEQQVTGAREFAGIPRYFSIALAKGFAGGPRDFRQTYEIMRDYRLLSTTGDNAVEKAGRTAWNDCVRIFRGTTCKTPGAVYTKDLAYMGNREVWTLVSKDSDVVETFSVGKFDPTNERHVALLSQLGILDSDLNELDT
ncbi:MAG: tyrosine/phenylalanine carboxypeptidase domain-containing protein [Candidatus Paceibacterota bacterium]